ncbi:MAG TPA: histidine kinase, partial [Candidatus Sulfomarinibacteraceae bacterium]|nr:histidine kinase [Candidatus Sulfomarinibacteraceae bacterium]
QPVGFLKKRWVAPMIYGLPYLILSLYLLVTRSQAANLIDWMGRWEWFTGPHAAVFLSLSFMTVIWQYRTNTSGVTRQQIRLLVLAAMLVAGIAVALYFLPAVAGVPALDSNVMGLIGILFPLAVAISILRHNLFDIDTLLNRALVYGGLTTVVIALYTVVVSLLSTFFQAGGNLFVALVATGLVAILFQPLRERLQRAVNRLMYGERDEPFEVLARLGERLESTLAPEMIYPTIVETVAQTLKLPYAAIAVKQEGRMTTVESYGKPVPDPITYPLSHQGVLVGQLQVARRGPDEEFSDADERLLRNIARQAGTAVHAVQLTADLQRSRQQLVTAREEERRRLRRDLHDGLGPHLASQTLTIDAIGKLLTRDPQRAQALLQDLKTQSKTAVHDIRRLVYDLRPPALDELGLVGALREGAARQSQNGLSITVEAPSSLPPLPAAVEVAAYRIAQEAVNNVLRHAQADTCTVRLAMVQASEPQALRVEIADDGRGIAPDYRAGVGLQSMRERAAELGGSFDVESPSGGGTRVTAVLPLPQIPHERTTPDENVSSITRD